jgi:hypothetical protein
VVVDDIRVRLPANAMPTSQELLTRHSVPVWHITVCEFRPKRAKRESGQIKANDTIVSIFTGVQRTEH